MIDFTILRNDTKHHLGLGDIRLTIDQQQEIEQTVTDLLKVVEALLIVFEDQEALAANARDKESGLGLFDYARQTIAKARN